jgi:hypothetical protein
MAVGVGTATGRERLTAAEPHKMDEFANRKYPGDEHFHFQRRTWVIERIGWCVLAAIPLLALTGLFGGGGISERTVGNNRLTVQYERFERRTRLAHFVFQFAPEASAEQSLRLNRAFQENYEVTSIQPAPIGRRADTDGIKLSFATTPEAGHTIIILAHPHSYGFLSIEARANTAPAAVQLPVLIYP